MTRLFCFGLGYAAAALARRLAAGGWAIAGTAREPEVCARFAAHGCDMHLFPGADGGELRAALARSTHVLLSVPPGERGDPSLPLLAAALPAPQLLWLGYLSSTAVYGDCGGAAVDEETKPRPSNERGRRRLAAEESWRALATRSGLPLTVFRLAGIYGPGRSALDLVRSGKAVRVSMPGHVFSRIHIEDLTAVLEAAVTRPSAGRLFTVCDDEPAAQSDVLAYAAGLLGRPVPPELPFDRAPLSAAQRSFYEENKRVLNRRMKDRLGVGLRYPTYREGLAAILAAELSGRGALPAP